MSGYTRKPQDFSPPLTTERPPRASNQISNPTSTRNHPQQGSTIEQQHHTPRHPSSQSTNSRSQQEYEMHPPTSQDMHSRQRQTQNSDRPRRPSNQLSSTTTSTGNHPQQVYDLNPTMLVGQSHSPPFNSGQSTNNAPMVSHQPSQASRSTDNRQIYDTRATTQTSQLSGLEPPVRGSMDFIQDTSSRHANSHSQQIYDTTGPSSQSIYDHRVSVSHDNTSSMTPGQSSQAPRANNNRSQQVYDMGTPSSTAQTHNQFLVSDLSVRNSRRADNGLEQGHDLAATRSAGQGHNHSFGSGQSLNSPSMTSHQPPRASQGTDNPSQPVYDTRPTIQTQHQSPRSEQRSSKTSVPSRRADNYPQQVYDTNYARSISQSTYGDSISGPHDSVPPNQASWGTGGRSQQGYDMDSTKPIVPVPHSAPVRADSSSEGPFGRDLAGAIKILTAPNQSYPWMIGTGASTDVFKGQCLKAGIVDSTPAYVAVKLFRVPLDEELEDTKATSRRLIRESKVWLRLKHPNIQPYLGHCSGLGPSIALISPLCERGCVKQFITKNASANRPQLVKDVAEGLKYLHSNKVIHADLHPKNILVDDQGRARLTDFGRAKVIGEKGYSTALLAGSAPYMAPELFPSTEPEVNVDELFSTQTDVYSFAMSCFEILTNEKPFVSYKIGSLDWQVVPLILQGKRPKFTSKVQGLISPDMWMIMESCWTSAPENRLSAQQIVQYMS